MGQATINLGVSVTGVGDTQTFDHSFNVSGVTNIKGHVGQISTTSASVGFDSLSNAWGIYIRNVSAASTNPILALVSGQVSGEGIKISPGEGCFFRPNGATRKVHLYSGKEATYEYFMFGV